MTKITSPKKPAKTTAAKLEAAPKGPGKLEMMVALLRRPEGARIDELQTATGWQAHSVRGAMSGALKKKQGLTIGSEKTEAGRVYRIVQGAGA